MTQPPDRTRRPNLLVTAVALLAVLVTLTVASLVFDALDRLLDLWERANAVSPVAGWLLLGVLLAFVAAGLAVLWWLWRPDRGRRQRGRPRDLSAELEAARRAGIDVSAAQAELDRLESPDTDAPLHIALFGEINAGKSSLINALAPGATARSGVLGGTSTTVTQHDWVSAHGERVVLSDVPGSGHQDADTGLAMDEARRAHLVLVVCEGDLSRTQWAQIEQLQTLGKPMLIVLNKQDRHAPDTLERLRDAIADRFPRGQRPRVVTASAGGRESVIRIDEQGTEQATLRDRPPQVDALRQAINTAIADDPAALSERRHHAVFALAADKLDLAQRSHRQGAAERIVAQHTRAAVVGALAAISPGTDLVIQGVIGTKLVRDLCALFEVRLRDVDTDALLKAAGSRARKSSALMLAVAGNGLKAFPGIGTITGGLAHAVAYGLLFDAFGKALVRTLIEQGNLDQAATLQHLDAELDSETLPARARRVAALALDVHKRP